ncbi:MAG: tetratricopeptide repeat protein [Methanosarcinaceae archaeon]|nr:tetratricopeptide repeat protein [Methanosarcinaceae archaeon]
MEEAINRKFPDVELTPLDREQLDHETFAQSRSKVYIGRGEYFSRLNAHVEGHNEPLVILGGSGLGKSALIANWALHHREKHPYDFVLLHFIGSTVVSADYAAMLRRIMGEIKRRYNLPDDIPDKPDELCSQFPNWLSMAAARGRFVLVLDGLNQLEDKDNAPDLAWLPEFIPPEVRLIVSTLPGRNLDALGKRNWPTLEMQPLEINERKQLINDYLFKLYSKKLASDQVEYIANQAQCANPLYLHALLEELRIFGQHETLSKRIGHYLKAQDPKNLYKLILERLEEDYETERPGLVGEAMTLLWAARRGLSEGELLEIMEVAPIIWSPLYLALEESLVTRSGLLGFFHDFLRQAVHEKYLDAPENEKQAHIRIADYFEIREIDQRKIEELPWQLEKASEWERLNNTLQTLSFLKAMWVWDYVEVVMLWTRIMKSSDYNITSSYEHALSNLHDYRAFHEILFGLFFQLARYHESIKISQAQINQNTVPGSNDSIIVDSYHGRSYQNLGKAYEKLGDYHLALENYKKAREIFQTVSGRRESAMICSLMGGIYMLQDRYEKAHRYFDEALDEFSSLYGNNNSYTAGAFSNLAASYEKTGQIEKSIEFNKKALEIFQKNLGENHPSVSVSFQGLGVAYYSIKDYESAIEYFKNALNIIIKTFGPEHPDAAVSYNDLGNAYGFLKNYKLAIEYHSKALDIRRKAFGEDHPDVAVSYINLAGIFELLENHDKALYLYEKALNIKITILGHEHSDIASMSNYIGVLLLKIDDYNSALNRFQNALKIYHKLYGSGHINIGIVSKNIGLLFEKQNDYDRSAEYYRKALNIRINTFGKNHLDVAESYEDLGSVYKNIGQFDDAINCLKNAIDIRIQQSDSNNQYVAANYNNLGGIYYRLGINEQAVDYFKKALEIGIKIDGHNNPRTATTSNNLGMGLFKLGQYDSAITYFNDAFEIRESLFGSDHPLTVAVNNNLSIAKEKSIRK